MTFSVGLIAGIWFLLGVFNLVCSRFNYQYSKLMGEYNDSVPVAVCFIFAPLVFIHYLTSGAHYLYQKLEKDRNLKERLIEFSPIDKLAKKVILKLENGKIKSLEEKKRQWD